ncbi:MAG: TlpA disulfide reductase family protein [Gammaproteobacteria bacterium]|nr:TlpA disulfide reductase family protein [Gammaproteobacteria bacterium]
MKNTLIFIVAIVIAGGSGFALHKYLNQKQDLSNPALGLQRPEFAVADLNGDMRNIKEWDGKLVLLNFWATWCPPCKKEIPDFIKLQTAYGEQGFQIVGIAIDDKEATEEYAQKVGMNYPSLVAAEEGVQLAQRFGNVAGVLPYSVIINRTGKISSTIRGELSILKAKELLENHGIQL